VESRDVLIYADTVRSPELRHEVPLAIYDPFIYGEHDGVRHVLIHAVEAKLLGGLGLELHGPDEYDADELVARGIPRHERSLELCARAVRAWEIESAVVPWSFPVELADRLRADGLALRTDRDLFTERRRRKSDEELAGIERAQRAADAAMGAVQELLARADAAGDTLRVAGEALTCERLKAEVARVLDDHGAACFDPIIARGAQTAIIHHEGEGAIAPGEVVVVDLAPRDGASGCFADMTRTFVAGEPPPDLAEWHALCVTAIEQAIAQIHPGVQDSDVFVSVSEFFREAGHPTLLDKVPGEPLLDGFFHGLGHGIGLEVHEPPTLSLTPEHRLVEGEVLAVEPGLYRQGLGGVRVEDLVVVTADGAERLTQFPYDLRVA
jgi:Xaa-Pro aminopeptidase